MRLVKIAGIAVAGAVLLSMGSASPVERVGYFKSPDRDRVVAFQAAAPLDAAAARAALEAAPFTAGRVFAGVIYPPGTPAPGGVLTAAPSLPAALAMVGEDFPGWSYRLRRNPAGVVTFDAAP